MSPPRRYLASKESLAERAVWDEPDTQLFKGGDDFRLRFPRPQRVLALQCGDRLNRVRAANRLRAGLGKAKVFGLALLHQVFDRARDVFQGSDSVLSRS